MPQGCKNFFRHHDVPDVVYMGYRDVDVASPGSRFSISLFFLEWLAIRRRVTNSAGYEGLT